jgi:hypothetical protein
MPRSPSSPARTLWRTTCCKADYDAATQVLGNHDHDHRLAQAKDAFAEARTGWENLAAQVQTLQELLGWCDRGRGAAGRLLR